MTHDRQVTQLVTCFVCFKTGVLNVRSHNSSGTQIIIEFYKSVCVRSIMRWVYLRSKIRRRINMKGTPRLKLGIVFGLSSRIQVSRTIKYTKLFFSTLIRKYQVQNKGTKGFPLSVNTQRLPHVDGRQNVKLPDSSWPGPSPFRRLCTTFEKVTT